MALFETTVKFKTYDMLVDMLELSNFMFNRHKATVNYLGSVYEFIPKFTFGRQVGKTDAVIRYARERKEKNLLIFVHNTGMLNYYTKELDDLDLRNSGKNTYVGIASANFNRFKGVDLSGYTIIFDELTTSQIQNILVELAPQLKDVSSMKMAAIIY